MASYLVIIMAATLRLKHKAGFSFKPPHKCQVVNQVALTASPDESENDRSKRRKFTHDASYEPDDNQNTRLQNIIRSSAILCG